MASGLTEAANLIVEDGNIIAGANSFVGIAAADAYATLRQTGPFIAWLGADESNKVAALITATDYLCRRWSWAGTLTNLTTPQSLCFPRHISGSTLLDSEGIDVSNTVPAVIIECQILYAMRAINEVTNDAVALSFDTNPQESDGRVVSRKREKLGPLEEETYYANSGSRVPTIKWRSYSEADECVRDSGLMSTSAGDHLVRS